MNPSNEEPVVPGTTSTINSIIVQDKQNNIVDVGPIPTNTLSSSNGSTTSFKESDVFIEKYV